jgi:hypothetical protein
MGDFSAAVYQKTLIKTRVMPIEIGGFWRRFGCFGCVGRQTHICINAAWTPIRFG